jgi:hypothetical protein
MIALDEIARLAKFAEAEAAFALVAPHAENPWAGAAARLAAAKEAHETAIVRERGERLVHLLADYREFNARLDSANEKVRELNAEQIKLENGPVVKRWKRAPAGARAVAMLRDSDQGDGWPHFAAWFVSGRSATNRASYEYPDPRWPAELRFSDDEREVIVRYFSLGAEIQQASNAATGIRYIIDTMVRDAPELAAVPLEKLEAAAA